MADVEFTHDVMGDERDGGSGFGTLANLIGAALSLALLIGIGVWAYKLVVRDVTGIPVVRAVEGPMRVQPENPGGRPADHQGLAVNAVAAVGSAEAPADTLILAPNPVSLADEDTPRSTTDAAVAPTDTSPASAEQTQPATQTTTNADAVSQTASSGLSSDIDALVAQITAGAEPLEPLDDVTQVAAAASDAQNVSEPRITRISADVPGVVRSLRPSLRPANLQTIAQPAPVATNAALDVNADEIPVGTRVVQLGAYPSPDVARAEWDRLAARFDGHLPGKQRVVQQATSGGRTFYRLRAMGFDDLSDARRFCSVLVAEGADCIPVVTR